MGGSIKTAGDSVKKSNILYAFGDGVLSTRPDFDIG